MHGPGAYSAWLYDYMCDKTRPKYLIAHPKLKWVRTNVTYVPYVMGAIKNFLRFGDYGTYDYYARVNYTTDKGTFQNIGYFWRTEVCVWNGVHDQCSFDDFDILVCID